MAIKIKYFSLTWSATNEDDTGVAYAPEDSPLAHELITQLQGLSELPFELTLKTVVENQNGLEVLDKLKLVEGTIVDFQPNSLAWPLMSEKMKQIVDVNLTGKDCIDWLLAKIRVDDDVVSYYIPRFKQELDVLDKENTMFVPGTDRIIKACFSSNKIKDYQLFPEPAAHELWRITSNLFVSDKLKKALQKGKVTGINFEKIKVI